MKLSQKIYVWSLLPLLAIAPATANAGAYHRTPLDAPNSTNLPPALLATNAPIQKVSENVYQIGLVFLDKVKRTISFPAQVNMAEGAVEYALVHSTGKVHESVLKTEAAPLHIHLAKLLLAGAQPPDTQPKSPVTPPELLGTKVRVWLSCVGTAGAQSVQMEYWISNSVTRAQMTPGPWIYNGSRVAEGAFLAHRDGSILAIIADPDALINNPRPGRDDDEIWTSYPGRVPPKGTPVTVTIELSPSS